MKHFLPILACATLLLMVMQGCVQEPPVPTIAIDKEELIVFAENVIERLHFTANCSWRVHGELGSFGQFFRAEPSSGEGDGFVDIVVQANPLAQRRLGGIIFSLKLGELTEKVVIPLRQEPAEAYGEFLSWDEVTIPAEGGSITAIMLSNTVFGIYCDTPDVILEGKDLSAQSGLSNFEFTITVPANPTAEPRTMFIVIFDRRDDSFRNAYRFFQASLPTAP